jgi:hypothetical protein
MACDSMELSRTATVEWIELWRKNKYDIIRSWNKPYGRIELLNNW